MKIKEFNYKTAPKTDSVVVLGAGRSLSKNAEQVKSYIKQNKSIVFASNYNFKNSLGIKSNYTYITDLAKFKSEIFSINSDLILPYELLNILDFQFSNKVKNVWENKRLNIFKVGCESKKHVYENNGILTMDDNGSFPYWSFGISGLGAMLFSSLCRPSSILIVGLDDPKPNKNYKIMYNGDKVGYDKPDKIVKVINYFEKTLVPTIYNMGIKIETFSDVGLFGLNKSKLKIKVI